MKWRFDDMLTFVQVMEAGSITAAAGRLNLSKSVVSKRIGDLETALNVALFQRSTRQVRPTECGTALYERMRPLIRDITETAERVAEGGEALQGRLRITAPMSFGTMHLGPAIAAFAQRHPGLELSLDYDDRMMDLVRDGYDVGIRIGILKDSSLVARKLCISRRVVCCSPGYARERRLPADVAALAAHDCIGYANVHTTELWQFEGGRGGRKPGVVALRSRIVANNGEAMRDLAIAGLGLAMLPLFIAAPALRAGTLIPALPRETPLPYAIYAVYPATRHVAVKVRAFIDHLAHAFVPPPAWERGLEGIDGLGQRSEQAPSADRPQLAGERTRSTKP